jgi:uncharacterized protein YcgL (UPF0745 family)
MQCFIYKSLKKDGLYLYMAKKDNFASLPEALLASVGKLVFVMALELTPERKLAREDSQKVLASLQDKGFFIQMPPSTSSLLSALQP